MHYKERERKSTALFRWKSFIWNFPCGRFHAAALSWFRSGGDQLLRLELEVVDDDGVLLNSLNWSRLELVTVECGGVRPLGRRSPETQPHYVSQAGIALSTATPSGPTPPRTADRFLTFSTDFHRPTQMWSYDWRHGKSIFQHIYLENICLPKTWLLSCLSKAFWELKINLKIVNFKVEG